jgi:hypothetical protein
MSTKQRVKRVAVCRGVVNKPGSAPCVGKATSWATRAGCLPRCSRPSPVPSPSLALLQLGSYARQNRIHQALAEIGRIHKTIHILRTLDDEEYRRRMGRELNKGEASYELSHFSCFGKEGALRGREFGDQLHTFNCLSVLHNAVVAWNMVHIEPVLDQLRAEGQRCDDELLSLTTPLLRRHLNPFGRY